MARLKLLCGMIVLVCLRVNFAKKITSKLPNENDIEISDDFFDHLNSSSFNSLEDIDSLDMKIKNLQDNPLANMNVTQVVTHYGYAIEAYEVETRDGYILGLHRITGNKTNPSPEGKPAVLLQHGLVCSSMDWVITGPERGLGFLLADAGYDVWMGNARGNKYSRKHRSFSAEGADFWNFSWHEIGKEDLTAMIDEILKLTGNERIFYVGHSQGTTAFYVMLSERPEYNEKITAMFSLAPVAYCSRMTSPVFQTLGRLGSLIDIVWKLIGRHEFLPNGEFFKRFAGLICDESSLSNPVCTNVLFLICGYSKEQLDMELLPAILAHTPAGSATKQVIHFTQLLKSGDFRQYDYGFLKNFLQYGHLKPPSYKLENIKVPVALHYSVNDWLSHPKDVNQLYTQLPNPIGRFRVPHEKFNHLDFLWAKDVKTLVYDKIINLMAHYRPT